MKLSLFLKYNEYVCRLKDLVRTGWVRSNVSGGETVAEHMYHTALNTIIIKEVTEDIDVDWSKILVMSLVHDLSESILGDIPTYEKTREDREREKEVLRDMLSELGYPSEWADEIVELSSKEGIIVKILDLISTVYQGIKYIEKGYCSDYLVDIVSNSISELDKLIGELESYQLTNLISFLRGYVVGYIRRCK